MPLPPVTQPVAIAIMDHSIYWMTNLLLISHSRTFFLSCFFHPPLPRQLSLLLLFTPPWLLLLTNASFRFLSLFSDTADHKEAASLHTAIKVLKNLACNTITLLPPDNGST
jgi:hypothetical protein